MTIKKKTTSEMIELGSRTAKNGFSNERDVVKKFENWKRDSDAKEWLILMGCKLDKIETVKATILHGHKTDVHVQITVYRKKTIFLKNLSIKLVSNPRGFNQVDKRWVDVYARMWEIPNDVTKLLKMFTGEIKPGTGLKLKDKKRRRMFLTEMNQKSQDKIISFFSKNKIKVASNILKGSSDDSLAAEWIMVALKVNNKVSWVLKSVDFAISFFGSGNVVITKRGSLFIGKIFMQRKGGDGGRKTAQMLQFKINPVELFQE